MMNYEELIKEYDGNWANISISSKLDEEFINKYANKIIWHLLLVRQKLSCKCIDRNMVYIKPDKNHPLDITDPTLTRMKLAARRRNSNVDNNWKLIELYQRLDGWFLHKYADNFEFRTILNVQKIPYDFILEHIEKIKKLNLINVVCIQQDVSDEFILENSEYLSTYDIQLIIDKNKIKHPENINVLKLRIM